MPNVLSNKYAMADMTFTGGGAKKEIFNDSYRLCMSWGSGRKVIGLGKPLEGEKAANISVTWL